MPRTYRAVRILAGAALGLLLAAPARGQAPVLTQLNENCTVSVLNRNVRVRPDGSWVLPNVPANFGFVRARATCIVNGETISGESDPFLVPANGVVNLPRIIFHRSTPIPQSLAITPAGAVLNNLGATLQLTVTARYSDGSTKDVTGLSAGTQYIVSNPAIATISPDGLVESVKAGTVIIQATHEGASGMTSVRVVPSSTDTDGDGLPDEYEIARGFDANNPIDAQEDPDRDGLTNLQEFQRGTDPRLADTDGDGLNDGAEIARGTDPLVIDSDGDGIADGLEVQTGSNPLDPASQNLSAALASIAVTPAHFGLTFNTVIGEASVQLKVIGTMRDGRTLDVTSSARGTNYASDAVTVCSFGARDGQVFAGVTGGCTITVTSNTFTATATGDIATFSPTSLGSISIPGYANNVDVNGSFAYVAAGAAGLIVVDASDPAVPRIVGSVDTPGNANDVRVVGNLAYVADGASGLQIIDVSNPTAPVVRGAVNKLGDASDVIVQGSLAYVAGAATGLHIIDVSDPAAPKLARSLTIPGTTRGVDVSGSIAVVVTEFPPTLKVIDISNPGTAKVVGSIALAGQPTDVSLGNGHAFVAAYTGGAQIVDVRQPAAPVVVGGLPGSAIFPPPPDALVPRDVQFAGQFAIFAEQLFGPAIAPIVDVSDPKTPRFRAFVNFVQDYAGTGIAVSGPFVYWTGQSFVVGAENGTNGQTKLFIGQYLALEDRGGVPPTVSITTPADGAEQIAGTKLVARATAADDVGVASVTFYVNGQPAFLDTSEPFEYSFIAPSTPGTLILGATAVDLGNNTATANNVAVSVVPDPLTTVIGRVLDAAGQPIEGVTVSVLSHVSQTAADGTFAITGVPTLKPFVIVSAVLVRGGETILGASAPATPVRSGNTDVGDITATATTFETSLGERVSTFNVPLPFDFPIAGGVRRSVHIGDGYLWTNEGDSFEAYSGHSLSPDPDNPDSGVYVNDDLPGRFVVTWYRTTPDGGGGGEATLMAAGAGTAGVTALDISHTITAQIVLYADGRIQYGYQGVEPQRWATTALRPAGATQSTAVDFSAGDLSMAAGEAVFENFDMPWKPFDLAGGFVVFVPNAGGYDIRPVPDVVAPICAVTPASGSVLFEGEPITIAANATDNGAVNRVRFQSAEGELDVEFIQEPFEVPFVVPVGVSSITFEVTAFDGWGNGGSCTSTVSVVPGPPPTSTITSVAAGATLVAGATVPITIDAVNRVPVTKVDFAVNGVVLASDAEEPFEFLFTVPAGVGTLGLSTVATDSVGKTGASTPLTVSVTSDPLTTVQGRVVDRTSTPVSGADVTANVHGATVEIFNFDSALTALPDLTGRTPDKTTIISAINLRNPGGMFGIDPFGFGTSPSRATRITATLKTVGAASYTFKLGVKAGGMLRVNGIPLINLANDTGQFQEGTETREVTESTLNLEILTFDNGNPEVQLTYSLPGVSQLEVIESDELTPAIVPFRTTSQPDGTFAIANVPTVLGPITVKASKVTDGKTAQGHSAAIAPVPGGVTDAGTVKLNDFGTLYGAAFSGPTGMSTLYTVDPTTGVGTLVGSIGFWRVSAMDVAANGTIYATGRNPVTRRHVLLTIDPSTGAGTEIGPTGVESLGFGDTIADIAFRPSDGVLFAYLEAGDGLGRINVATGAATPLGDTWVNGCCGNGMAFAPDGRLLHANEWELYVLDQITGLASVVAQIGYPFPDHEFPRISSMKFRPETSELFGFMKSDLGTFLVRIDSTTAVVTPIGAATVNGFDAITWGPSR
jgi:hypothetical protein